MTGSNPVLVTAGVLPRAALVADLSTAGLGLLATFAPPVGSVLPVWVPGRPGETSTVVLVKVIHVVPGPDNLYRIGTTVHDPAGGAALRELYERLRAGC